MALLQVLNRMLDKCPNIQNDLTFVKQALRNEIPTALRGKRSFGLVLTLEIFRNSVR